MARKKELKQNTALKIKNHPDFNEICSKLLISIEPSLINEWLKGKYSAADKSLIISIKDLEVFRDEYLDFYNQISEDLEKVKSGKSNKISADLQDSIYNNATYKERLNEYLDKEVDIKKIIKNMVIAIESRAMQVFDYIQQDNRNMKNDRILIEWFQTLLSTLEKYDSILNGSPNTVINQNTVNIQIIDRQINVFHKVIREVLSRLDYDTSMLFLELFNEELTKLKQLSEHPLPIDIRLDEVKKIGEETKALLE